MRNWINRIQKFIRKNARGMSIGLTVAAVLAGNLLSAACGSTELAMTQQSAETENVLQEEAAWENPEAGGSERTSTSEAADDGKDVSFESDPAAEESGEASSEMGAEMNAEMSAKVDAEARMQVTPSCIYVDVCGAVESPGVYLLEEGARVCDAIKAAGGFSLNASASSVNQARKLTDQEQIYIYSMDEMEALQKGETVYVPAGAGNAVNGTKTVGETAGSISGSGTETAGDAGVSSESVTGSETVNLNTATLEQLETLPGIGETKARAILEYRQEHGSFEKPQELTNVSGIGDATYAKLQAYVVTE